MTLLIIGVDPGTTRGYAILDDKGELISTGSGKNISLSELINNIICFGKPLILGCDKNPAPGFAEKTAVKLGAKLFHPKRDLLVKEKKALISRFDVKLNDHERDALASAALALARHKAFLNKINRFLKKKNKQELEEDVKLIMMRNNELPLQAALEKAEKKSRGFEKKTAPLRPRYNKKQAAYDSLPSKKKVEKEFETLRARNALLEEKNKRLEKSLTQKNRLVIKLKKKIRGALKGTSQAELVNHKENRIKYYSQELKKTKRNLRRFEKKLARLNNFVGTINPETVLVKKLGDLSTDEYKAKGFLNITQDDVLMVKDPASVSPGVIEKLGGGVRIIITNKLPRKKPAGILFLKPGKIIIAETEHYALATKQSLEKELNKKDILNRVIDDYKESRTNKTNKI